jgi:hypothetical protein
MNEGSQISNLKSPPLGQTALTGGNSAIQGRQSIWNRHITTGSLIPHLKWFWDCSASAVTPPQNGCCLQTGSDTGMKANVLGASNGLKPPLQNLAGWCSKVTNYKHS